MQFARNQSNCQLVSQHDCFILGPPDQASACLYDLFASPVGTMRNPYLATQNPQQTASDPSYTTRPGDTYTCPPDNAQDSLKLSETPNPTPGGRRVYTNILEKRNARERDRVRLVNTAFRRLQRHLPEYKARKKRVSKLKILRSALTYIATLSDTLGEPIGQGDFPYHPENDPDYPINDHMYTTSPPAPLHPYPFIHHTMAYNGSWETMTSHDDVTDRYHQRFAQSAGMNGDGDLNLAPCFYTTLQLPTNGLR